MDKIVTVCDSCFMASCWHGEFMCDEAQMAGTVEKTADELIELNIEHWSHWLSVDEYKTYQITGSECLQDKK